MGSKLESIIMLKVNTEKFAHQFVHRVYGKNEYKDSWDIINKNNMIKMNEETLSKDVIEIMHIPFINKQYSYIPRITYLFGTVDLKQFVYKHYEDMVEMRIGEEFLPEGFDYENFNENDFLHYHDDSGNQFIGTLVEIPTQENNDCKIEVVSFRYLTEAK